MVEVNIDDIDVYLATKITGIYAIIKGNKAYVGKSVNILSRLKCHKSSTLKGGKMYILEAYKNISKLDLMIMEDFYLCKFIAYGYEMENVMDPIYPRIKRLLMGSSKSVKLYKEFEQCEMKSSMFEFEKCINKNGLIRMKIKK